MCRGPEVGGSTANLRFSRTACTPRVEDVGGGLVGAVEAGGRKSQARLQCVSS